jgi:phosphonate transport system permease protein
MATVFGVLVAMPLSFLAARNLMRGPLPRLIYMLVRVISSLTRSVDAIIWAIIFAVWVGMGSFAGALALWLHSIADLVKLYSEQLESIDPGPIEAVTATGANRLQVIRYGIIPQIINPYLSFTLYRWDINVRMATVVGGGGIGWRLYGYLKAWQFAEASMFTILIIALVWAIDYVSARLRAKLA